MDKSWIDLESKTPAYLRGIDAFLDFAFKNRPNDTTISCRCEKCDNRYFQSRMDIRDHCFFNGFSKNYKNWTYHGESYVPIQRPTVEASRFQNNELRVDNEGDNIVGLLYEAMGMQRMSDNEMNDGESSENNDLSGANKETLQFYQMLEDASLELYPGCAEFTKFSFITHLLNLKVVSGWTNTSFTLLLNLLEKTYFFDSYRSKVDAYSNFSYLYPLVFLLYRRYLLMLFLLETVLCISEKVRVDKRSSRQLLVLFENKGFEISEILVKELFGLFKGFCYQHL
ncbi:hypothetical protein ACJIZ3_008858 [Penstemon smallii]|uniref:Transposase-associated domain-containing protein n=1 Tax=Penstemon smallii TaxID=265156 RepID=A0ABD3TAY2_9LAMI